MGPKYSLFFNIPSDALSVIIVFDPLVNTTLANIFFPIYDVVFVDTNVFVGKLL
jgi:hypothetical protein